jgi:hypothetical protein
MFFSLNDFHWPTPRCPIRSLPIVVLLQTPRRVVGHANIIGPIGTFEDIAAKHLEMISLLEDVPPLGSALGASLGTKSLRREDSGGGGSRNIQRD